MRYEVYIMYTRVQTEVLYSTRGRQEIAEQITLKYG